jgi:hypothetical protein
LQNTGNLRPEKVDIGSLSHSRIRRLIIFLTILNLNVMDIQMAIKDFCLRSQELLKDSIGNENLPNLKIQSTGTIAGALDPANRNLVRTQGDLKGPKNTTLQVMYFDADRTAASATEKDYCVAGDTPGEKFAEIKVDKVASVDFTLNRDAFRDLCSQYGEKTDYAQMHLAQKANQLLVKLNKDAVTNLNANHGNNADGNNNPIILPLVTPKTAVNPLGELRYRSAWERLEVMERAILSGGGIFSDYAHLKDISCCSEVGINNASKAIPWSFFRDPSVGVETGNANDAFAWTPGAFQVFFREKHTGEFMVSNPDIRMVTMLTQVNGVELPINMVVNYEKCNGGRFIITYTLDYGFFTMPTDIEAEGSPWYGVNNILKFRAECSDDGYCASGS